MDVDGNLTSLPFGLCGVRGLWYGTEQIVFFCGHQRDNSLEGVEPMLRHHIGSFLGAPPLPQWFHPHTEWGESREMKEVGSGKLRSFQDN